MAGRVDALSKIYLKDNPNVSVVGPEVQGTRSPIFLTEIATCSCGPRSVR